MTARPLNERGVQLPECAAASVALLTDAPLSLSGRRFEETARPLTFTCENCQLDWDDTACDCCGASLVRTRANGVEPSREGDSTPLTEGV